jgi:hypothetical protein
MAFLRRCAMTAAQKHAWFNLVVVALSVVTVLILVPVLGPGAQGGFGLLGLLGFGSLFVIVQSSCDRSDNLYPGDS